MRSNTTNGRAFFSKLRTVRKLVYGAGCLAAVCGFALFIGQPPDIPDRPSQSRAILDGSGDAFLPAPSSPLAVRADDPLTAVAGAQAILQKLSQDIGLPEDRPLTLDQAQDAYAAQILTPDVPMEAVAAALRKEREHARQKANGEAGDDFSSYTMFALLPYLVEAGMCRGDIWSETGMICDYFDVHGNFVRPRGRRFDPASGEEIPIRPTPSGSRLETILQLAAKPGLSAHLAKRAPKQSLYDIACKFLPISSAHAQELPPEAGETAKNCFDLSRFASSKDYYGADPKAYSARELWPLMTIFIPETVCEVTSYRFFPFDPRRINSVDRDLTI